MSKSTILISNGRKIDPLDFQLRDVDMNVPLNSLPRLPRYSGQTKRTYRVAEHVVKLYEVVPGHLRRAALLHDCSEGFGLLDFAHPIKKEVTGYEEIEERMLKVIFSRFNVPWNHMEELSSYDRRMCQDEMMQVFEEPYDLGLEPLGVEVEFWDEGEARHQLDWAFLREGLLQ